MAVPSQLTVSEGLMGGDNYREDDGAGHYLTGGSWSNLIGILSVHCMRITQSFEYSNVIEAEGEVYILEVLAVTSDVTTSYVCCCPGTTVRPHVQSRGPPTCQMGKYKTTKKYISLLLRQQCQLAIGQI